MSGPAEKEDLAWLSSYFSQLVAQARENWIPFGALDMEWVQHCCRHDHFYYGRFVNRHWPLAEIVEAFLSRGAKKAVDIIYDAVGPVGPPVRPGSGSLFIVDERRLKNWRDDGYVPDSAPLASSYCNSSFVQIRLRATSEFVLHVLHGHASRRHSACCGGMVESAAPTWATAPRHSIT